MKQIIVVGFVLLVLLNALLLATNITLNKKISRLQSENGTEEKIPKFVRIEQSLIDKTVMELGAHEIESLSKRYHVGDILRKKRVAVLFVFSSLDCSNCLREEVQRLNELISEGITTSAQVFGLGMVETLDRTFVRVMTGGIEPLFPIFKLEKPQQSSIHIHTPAIVLADSVGRIFMAYLAETGNEVKSRRFHRALKMLLGQ